MELWEEVELHQEAESKDKVELNEKAGREGGGGVEVQGVVGLYMS